jgi:RIO-like serine/threonine protein kinase
VWGGMKHQKMLFEAKRLDTGAKIMVKYTDTYSMEVHKALSNAGLAPELYDVQEQAGMFMVVMDCLEDIRPWHDEDALNDVYREQLLRVQTVLKRSEFVHGDLRAPNVCVQEKNMMVYIVDFDWAGKAGEVHYPVVLNPNVNWPRGAEVGTKILIEHDNFMINEMLGHRKRKLLEEM